MAGGGGRWAVVGLGNPGPRYRRHRHNVGFMIVDRLSRQMDIRRTLERELWRGVEGELAGRRVVLVTPLTYMNRSGAAVADIVRRYGMGTGQVVVLHDDLDMEVGKVRFKPGGGHGGHNGLRSIIDRLGSREFPRVKVGIGRPPAGRSAEEWVLSDFSPDEREVIERGIEAAVERLQELIRESGGTAADAE